MVPGGDKALDGNSMTGGFGTPTQEMVESYEYADGSGFPRAAHSGGDGALPADSLRRSGPALRLLRRQRPHRCV